MKVQDMDKNMVSDVINTEDVCWYDPMDKPFRISGLPFIDEDHVYRRLPLSSINAVEAANPNVNELAWNTAGGQIGFRTDSPSVSVRVWLRGIASLPHMAATGECGFDCYAESDSKMIFRGCSKFDFGKDRYEAVLCTDLESGEKDFILNFPLYMGVEKVLIGLKAGCAVAESKPFLHSGRVIAYGTSITQGGCSSRPGMAYTNILSRSLKIEFFNLGFSGNGLGEQAVAHAMASVRDARLFLLDHEVNSAAYGTLEASLPVLTDTIRRSYPLTPILILSSFRIPSWLNPEKQAYAKHCHAYQKDFVQSRQNNGDQNIFYLNGESLLDGDWHECTVDGVHPTDLGFFQIARSLEGPLCKLLNL